MSEKLLKAAVNAHNTIEAVYKWIDQVNEAGGTASISGIAKAHAMFESMEKNRKRLDKLVTEPLLEAIEEAKEKA